MIEQVLQNLDVLRARFAYFDSQWAHLKDKREFVNEVKHASPIREMYAEGRSCAGYLKNCLDISHINKTMLLDEYVALVKKTIPPQQIYESTGWAAYQDIEESYSANHTAKDMLNLYWEQWQTVARVEEFLFDLITSPEYQLLVRPSPIQVIRQYVKNWEQDAQLHQNLGETGLRSQLLVALRAQGFQASGETQAYQGHADIVVAKPLVPGITASGHLLVAECKMWRGAATLDAAASQLCQYVTSNDSHAALIFFVNKGSFVDICSEASLCLAQHVSCGGMPSGADHIDYWLRPAQNPELEVPATLIMCNLTTPRYPR